MKNKAIKKIDKKGNNEKHEAIVNKNKIKIKVEK
jgi:hypothetical protein